MCTTDSRRIHTTKVYEQEHMMNESILKALGHIKIYIGTVERKKYIYNSVKSFEL